MGGAVSSGESNDDLVDNLLSADYIKTPDVESVFRAVDRGFYFTKEHRASAYKDLAWKDGNLHISAPCIYTEVMENLRIKPGMSFLNVGSGTGYFSTVVGLLLGRTGINHGIEIHEDVVQYARSKLAAFLHSSPAIDLFDFALPEFVAGNICEILPGSNQRYDRIYCGAACTKEEAQLIVNLLKIGGISIIPLNDSLLQITRASATKLETKTLLSVSFATLLPSESDPITKKSTSLPGWNARGLKELCRAEIRDILRKTLPPPPPVAEIRKRKVFKRRKQRRANRLLLVQRRRRENHLRDRVDPYFEFSHNVDDDTSTDDDESGRCRSPPSSNIPNSTATKETNHTVESQDLATRDSGTESGEHHSMPYVTKPDDSAASPSPAQLIPVNKAANTILTPTVSVITVDTPNAVTNDVVANLPECSITQKPCSTSTTPESMNACHEPSSSTVCNNGPSNDQPPRCLRTVRILERIREIIRRRQLERQAQAPPPGVQDLQSEFDALEAAIENPSVRNPGPREQEAHDGEDMEFDCLWSTTDEDSTSSSSSSDDDSMEGNELVIVENGGRGIAEQIEIGALGQEGNSGRRPRRISFGDSSDEEDEENSMHVTHPFPAHILLPQPPPPRVDGRSNIEIEIEVLEQELNVSVPLTNVMSIELRDRINLLPLPPPVKNFLNYGRQ